MKYKYIVSVCLWFFSIGFPTLQAQTHKHSSSIRPLTIGDKVPNLQLSGLMNYTSTKDRVNKFKAKLLLVDFWATWCGSCIASFPKLEKIKKQLGSDFNVLLVTEEDKNRVDVFNKLRKRFGKDSLEFSSICDDKILKKLFPHQSLPHYVWIDNKGIVKAITSASEVSVENVKAMIEGKYLLLQEKNDASKESSHDILKPLFINGNGGNGEGLIWYSLLSKMVNGLQNVTRIDLGNNYGFIQIPNIDIYSLYKFAYSDDGDFNDMRLPNSRIIFDVKDSIRYIAKFDSGKLIDGQLFCYNLITPSTTNAGLKKYMQDDLKKYFGLNVNWGKRKMKCLVLTVEDTTLIAPVSMDVLKTEGHSSSDYNFISLNNPIKYFRRDLSEGFLFYSPYPIRDESGYRGKAYFEIEANMADWQSIDKALVKYKMHLNLEDREVNVLTVTESN